MPIWTSRPGRGARLPRAEVDVPWRQGRYCVLDFETTGLNLKQDDIVSVGLVPILDGRIHAGDSYYRLVRPRRPSSVPAVQIHGLTERELAGAVSIEECATVLAAELSQRVLVAHAAWIEEPLIERALAAVGRRFHGQVIDTAALARALELAPPAAQGEPDLEWLSARLGVPAHTPHHALGDALTTAQVFLALCSTLARDQRASTAADLIRLR